MGLPLTSFRYPPAGIGTFPQLSLRVVAGVSTGQSLHPSRCGGYVRRNIAGDLPPSGRTTGTLEPMDSRASETSEADAEPSEAEAAQSRAWRPARDAG